MTCPACGEAAGRRWRLATTSDPQLAGADALPLWRCAACGSAFLPADLVGPVPPALYEAGRYGEPRRLADALVEPLRRLIDRERTLFASALPPGGRVFEVGAGDGRVLAALGRAGLHASGLEPARRYAAEASRRGATVATAGVEDYSGPSEPQDAVMIWHVLEHLDEPAVALARAREWLRPDGLLVVGVPNLDSLQARIGGDRWFHQDIPRHRIQFTPAGLRRLLESEGFEVVRERHLLLEHNLLGMWQTVLNAFTREPDTLFRLMKGNLVHRRARDRLWDLTMLAVAGPLLVVPTSALEVAAGLLRRGGTIAVEARRRPDYAA